jgi:DNA segregation ATPase FtsK/SpoIIIE-like protein
VPPWSAAAARFDDSPWRDELTDAPVAADADAAFGAERSAEVVDATTAADAEAPALANDGARRPAGGNGAETAVDGTPTSPEPRPIADPVRPVSDANGMDPATGMAAAAPAEEPIRHDAEASTPPATVSPVAPADAEDPIVTIPRPEPAIASRPGAPDEVLMREAVELVLATRRANAVFLQRKLRIDYDLAAAVLVELAARGIVALDAEATHGRILV